MSVASVKEVVGVVVARGELTRELSERLVGAVGRYQSAEELAQVVEVKRLVESDRLRVDGSAVKVLEGLHARGDEVQDFIEATRFAGWASAYLGGGVGAMAVQAFTGASTAAGLLGFLPVAAWGVYVALTARRQAAQLPD